MDGVNGLLNRIEAWTKAPFTRPLDPIAFLGLTLFAITVSYMWTRVLRHVFEE